MNTSRYRCLPLPRASHMSSSAVTLADVLLAFHGRQQSGQPTHRFYLPPKKKTSIRSNASFTCEAYYCRVSHTRALASSTRILTASRCRHSTESVKYRFSYLQTPPLYRCLLHRFLPGPNVLLARPVLLVFPFRLQKPALRLLPSHARTARDKRGRPLEKAFSRE